MIVKTTKGKVEAATVNGVTAFKGIPFAKPPVGDLRWRPPEPMLPWSNVRRADTFGKACIQPVVQIEGFAPILPENQSEDCLYLNVWTASSDVEAQALRPVMVWIHGGAFLIGDGSAAPYDATALAKQGAVVVTLNYRLGHLGFFSHPALQTHTALGPVNFGLLDQIEALKWVQHNIAGFGGDPDNVTIFGQSAGAVSVLALFSSPLAANLFHRGIAQSPYAIPERSFETATRLGRFVATNVFGAGDRPTANDLRAIKASKFAQSYFNVPPVGISQPVPSLAPAPIFEDPVLPERIRDTFMQQRQRRQPLMIGSNDNEQTILDAFGMKPEAVLEQIKHEMPGGELLLEAIKELYRGDPEPDRPDHVNDPARFGGLVLRDVLFTQQVYAIADAHAATGAPVHRYYFTHVPQAFRPHPAWARGTPHGGEVVFPFNNTLPGFDDADRRMAVTVSNYWFSFAQTGAPMGAVEWPAHTIVEDRTLELGARIEVHEEFRVDRLDLFRRIYPLFVPMLDGSGLLR
jgi:para-nitrobenzyl esterase